MLQVIGYILLAFFCLFLISGLYYSINRDDKPEAIRVKQKPKFPNSRFLNSRRF